MNQLLKRCLILLLSSLFISGRREGRVYTTDDDKWVSITEYNGGYRLHRYGKPYFIKGANITDGRYLRDLQRAGANSVRIYGTEHAGAILDSAYKLGLTVTIGLNMAYAGRDMDYNDPKAVTAQLETLRREVLKYRNHPALLMWGVGNETGMYLSDGISHFFDHIRLSKAINAVAQMIHRTDPNHPTAMMVQGSSSNRFNSIFCDEVDVIAYNSFEAFDEQRKNSYWKGPYIIAEFGARGYWACRQTEWYNAIEQTSLEKASFMQRQYRSFRQDTANCLGSYAFLWGQKQEYTSTWFSLYTEQGEPTTLTDELQSLWTGIPAAKTVSIASIRIDNKSDSANIYLLAGRWYTAKVICTDLLPEDVTLRWEIKTDYIPDQDASHDTQIREKISGGIRSPVKNAPTRMLPFEFTAPAKEGPFRLFLYLVNGQHKVATANACFYVYH